MPLLLPNHSFKGQICAITWCNTIQQFTPVLTHIPRMPFPPKLSSLKLECLSRENEYSLLEQKHGRIEAGRQCCKMASLRETSGSSSFRVRPSVNPHRHIHSHQDPMQSYSVMTGKIFCSFCLPITSCMSYLGVYGMT